MQKILSKSTFVIIQAHKYLGNFELLYIILLPSKLYYAEPSNGFFYFCKTGLKKCTTKVKEHIFLCLLTF